AFRLGLAEIRVGNEAHRLDVTVTPDKATYPVRGKAHVVVQVKLPDGKPAANGEVALAAVDQSLLELMPNTSWNLLDAMLQRRSYGVETSTAQMRSLAAATMAARPWPRAVVAARARRASCSTRCCCGIRACSSMRKAKPHSTCHSTIR